MKIKAKLSNKVFKFELGKTAKIESFFKISEIVKISKTKSYYGERERWRKSALSLKPLKLNEDEGETIHQRIRI
jgi:hypothetical protein